MLSTSSLLLIGGLLGAVVLTGAGLRAYSRKIQQRDRARLYRMIAQLICRHLNEAQGIPCSVEQVEQLLICGKHGNTIPGLHQAKLRVVYSQKGRFELQILLYVGKELVTITVKDQDWVNLPSDIQSAAIYGAGAATEFMLLD